MAGLFIEVKVDASVRDDADLARRLEEACPVDIYADAGGRVEVIEENLDECVLCQLCLRTAPAETVHVRKLYDGTELAAEEATHGKALE